MRRAVLRWGTKLVQRASQQAAAKDSAATLGARRTDGNPESVHGALRTFRRPFSAGEQPKRGFENFYPKGKNKRSKVEKNGSSGENGGSKSGEDPKTLGEAMQNKGFQQSLLTTALLAMALSSFSMGRSDVKEISFQEFQNKLLEAGLVERLEVSNKNMVKVYIKPPAVSVNSTPEMGDDMMDMSPPQPQRQERRGGSYRFYFNIGSVESFERKLEDAQRALGIQPKEFLDVTYTNEWSWQQELLRLAPTILLIAGYVYFTRRQLGGGMGPGVGGGGGSRGIFNVGKAQVTVIDKNAKNRVMFKDVAGCDEAKQEVMEFVEFLRNPKKYKDLGASIPKGALLVGPPGTGKTLLAKATAGEANVPFLSISGSDFMEMFVGVGPARVRDLFAQARSNSPSIIFIDEVDAIGRARGRGGFAGGNDERENTLNQLLVEMDGFGTTTGVVVLAGTNRPDILDQALLRPGRFDRQISIDRPDIKGREQIFRVYLKKLRLDHPPDYYSQRLAALTPGFAGADIANVCNEAALIAARKGAKIVEMVDFESAVDRVIGGLEKKNKVISAEERRTVAFHEAGHAVVGWFLEYAEPLLKVSIIPRGTAALGFAQYLPSENLLMTTEQMEDMTCMTLGGRAAEEVLIGKISTGAQNDLEKITKMTYSRVAVYGMNKRVGLVSFPPDEEKLMKPFSNETAKVIDEEVRKLIDSSYDRTRKLVEEKKELVEKMALALLEREVLSLEEIEAILGKRPFSTTEQRNIDKFRVGFREEHSTDTKSTLEEGASLAENKDDGEGDGEEAVIRVT